MSNLQHVTFNKNLFLVQHTQTNSKQAVSVPTPTNHIWMYDRSGSMYGELNGVVKDLKALARTLRHGDTVTLGWFSGYKENNFMVKGFKICLLYTSDAADE